MRRLTVEQKALIAEDVRIGIKLPIVASRHGVHVNTVRTIAIQVRNGSFGIPKPTGTATPSQRLALSVTNYRLAIELARHALRLGRVADALTHLDQAVTPTH